MKKLLMSPVICLLLVCGPSAIFRRIVSIHVYPVEGFSGWAFAHVREKIFKFFPSLAIQNSSGSVIFIGFCVTSMLHSNPAFICTSFIHAMLRKSGISFNYYVGLLASTAFYFVSAKMCSTYNYFLAAFTATEVVIFPMSDLREFYYGQSSKYLPCLHWSYSL